MESARSTSKVEGKDDQLPVTDPALEVRPGYLKLFGPLDPKKNEYPFLWWIPEREARQRLRAGEVVPLRSSRRYIYSVHMVSKAPAESSDPAIPDTEKPASLRRKTLGDSHNRERDDNPAGVWTIDRVPRSTQKVFDAVLLSLLNPFDRAA